MSKMSVKPKQMVYKNPEHFSNLEHYKDAKIYSDITIKVDDKTIKAHKIILASTIPYFRAILCNDMTEKKQHEIAIHHIDSEVVETVINYAYSGQITIDERNGLSIIQAASFFGLNNVIEALDTTLLESIFTPENILSIRHVALLFIFPELLKKTNIFIEQYFIEVAKTESFLDLSVEDITDLLSNSKLNVSSEQQVLEALMAWITHDIEDRKSHIPQLMSRIRLHLISPEFLVNFVTEEELMRTSLDYRKEIDEALRYYHLGSREDLDNKCIHQRSCELSRGCFFSLSSDDLKSRECSFQKYNPLTNYSEKLKPLPVSMCRFGTTMYKNNYYVIGGYDGKKRFDTVYTYNCHENMWKSIGLLNKSCSSPAVAVLHDYMYKIGGHYETYSSISEVERYCPITGRWKTVRPMNIRRGIMQAVTYQGGIYVMCGYQDNGVSTSTVEHYDPRADQWRAVQSALHPRYGYASTLLNDRIYVFGGYNLNGIQSNTSSATSAGRQCLRFASVYDIRMDTWIEIAPMNTGRYKFGCVSNLGKIWVLGGFTSNTTKIGPVSNTEIYDPVSDSWAYGPSLTTCGGETHTEITPVFD